MKSRHIRYAAIGAALCLGVLAVGSLSASAAKPTGKVKFNTKTSGGAGIEGVVKHKKNKGVKKVKVILRGPAPFDPAAQASGVLVKIGVTRTDRRGSFCFEPPSGGSFTAGDYEAKAKKKGFKYRPGRAKL